MVAEIWNREEKCMTSIDRWRNKLLEKISKRLAKHTNDTYKKEKKELMRLRSEASLDLFAKSFNKARSCERKVPGVKLHAITLVNETKHSKKHTCSRCSISSSLALSSGMISLEGLVKSTATMV
jgi:hypothetical protein